MKLEILRLLADNQIWLSANNVAENLPYRLGYVRDELKELRDMGYLESKEDGGPFYRITGQGLEYLESDT